MSTIQINPVITKMTNIVNRYVSSFKEDFYNYDLPKVEKGKEFVWSLRKTGTNLFDCINVLKESYEKSLKDKTYEFKYNEYHRLISDCWSILRIKNNERFYHIKGGKIKKISQLEAIDIVKKAIYKKIMNA